MRDAILNNVITTAIEVVESLKATPELSEEEVEFIGLDLTDDQALKVQMDKQDYRKLLVEQADDPVYHTKYLDGGNIQVRVYDGTTFLFELCGYAVDVRDALELLLPTTN